MTVTCIGLATASRWRHVLPFKGFLAVEVCLQLELRACKAVVKANALLAIAKEMLIDLDLEGSNSCLFAQAVPKRAC